MPVIRYLGRFYFFALMNKRTHVPVVIATATVIIETGLGYVVQACLKCLYSRGYPASDSSMTGTVSACHSTQLSSFA